jgi:deoxyribodipyrimidine photo-lyase
LKKVTVFWFRRDLRLTDNHGLHQALQAGYPVLPLFIFDTNILEELPDRRDARVSFIYQTLQLLHQSLGRIGSGLLIRHGKLESIFQELISEF